jgi:hypothetical protein
MSGLAETDEQGRYSIQGIPQGRYYIAAGRVDFPTYYPGTQEMKAAVILSVAPGSTISGIDFVMTDSSVRLQGPLPAFASPVFRAQIPIQVRVEDGGKLPLFSGGKFTTLQLGQHSVAIAAPFVQPQNSGETDVRVDGLPEGYVVKSLTYGTVDLLTKRLNVPLPGPLSPPPVQTITIVLGAPSSSPSTSGVRVTGHASDTLVRSVYLSGNPGTYYSDGTFEFRGVPPGKHVLAGLNTPLPLGAIVVVGDRDVTGVELRDETTPVPFDMRSPRDPEPAGNATPGAVLPLASVRGTLLEQATQKPIADSEIKITGYARTEVFKTDGNGRFEIPRLFPGSYKVEVAVFGHENLFHTLTVGTENITLDLATRRLY